MESDLLSVLLEFQTFVFLTPNGSGITSVSRGCLMLSGGAICSLTVVLGSHKKPIANSVPFHLQINFSVFKKKICQFFTMVCLCMCV